jgi:hypothetical protein
MFVGAIISHHQVPNRHRRSLVRSVRYAGTNRYPVTDQLTGDLDTEARRINCQVAEHCWDPVGPAIVTYGYRFDRLIQARQREV